MNDEERRQPMEWWGGVECTVNRVDGHWFDQVKWSGHEWRDDDLQRFASLGIRAIRYPVLWERMAPTSLDDIDWRWTDRRLARLRELGIRPIIGLLHHGSGPAYTSLLDPHFPEKLARFAEAVARRYPWITEFTPVNEPLTTARFSALYGHWYPHQRTDTAFLRALVNQLRGVALAMRTIRRVVPQARLVQTEDCGKAFGTPATAMQVAHENHRRWLTWDLLTGAIGGKHPLLSFLRHCGFDAADEAFFHENVCPPDVIGLNYYLTSDRYLDERTWAFPEHTHGGNAAMRYADVEAVRALEEGIAGHETNLREAWERYRIPVALTEVHLACTREEQMRWLAEAWAGAQVARANGADVTAITAWALVGSYNWNSLVTRDTGHYEPGVFDVRSAVPRPTALAGLIARLAAGQSPSHPLFAVPGWWRRPERLTLGNARLKSAALPTTRPLLIVGRSGTLARAFARVCALRGLPAHTAGRAELDITDHRAIEHLIRRLRPWAIINAAGYVRVDDAEREPEECFRVNAVGPAMLAAVCQRRGLPLLTYSSDLVFDGTKCGSYEEADLPSPLNVYGASKAEAEHSVLSQLPTALVIRTSAFFGPWDQHNFLAHLFDALDRGQVFRAADNAVVSPTYVPDLVHASLDLLIDGERGIWHLANDGAISWYDFAMLAAVRSERSVDLIEPVSAATSTGAAARPAFTALASSRGRLLRSLDDALAAFLSETTDLELESSRCASL